MISVGLKTKGPSSSIKDHMLCNCLVFNNVMNLLHMMISPLIANKITDPHLIQFYLIVAVHLKAKMICGEICFLWSNSLASRMIESYCLRKNFSKMWMLRAEKLASIFKIN